uniref:Uncharacterized protein n=1 Tax=Arundo donax TaxID=35708 RepID=A0A0A9BSV2_ARUDO
MGRQLLIAPAGSTPTPLFCEGWDSLILPSPSLVLARHQGHPGLQ